MYTITRTELKQQIAALTALQDPAPGTVKMLERLREAEARGPVRKTGGNGDRYMVDHAGVFKS